MEKLTKNDLEVMTSNEIANHIMEITQTEICKDDAYCKLVLSYFTKKPLNVTT